MTYTILIFLYRKPSISPATFKEHYESSHMPLMQSVGGSHFPKSHVQRYIHRSTEDPNYPATVMVGAQTDFEYDAITELVFEDEPTFKEFFRLIHQGEMAERIAKYEEKYLDRSKKRVVVVDDCKVTNSA